MSNFKQISEAYIQMVSEKKSCKEEEMCPKCDADPCECEDENEVDEGRQMKDPKKDSMVTKGGKTIVIDKDKEKEYLKKGWTLAEKKELDPVNDKENDKPFAKRKDKDIDNDGDVDSSDEYLHKKRAATDDAIDGGKKPADNADDKKKKDKNPKTSDSTAEISKIGEATEELIKAMQEAIDQKKGATAPEGMDDKESKSGKDFKAKHKVDKLSHDDMEKIEEPKERTVKKEMREYEVIRAILSGNPTGE